MQSRVSVILRQPDRNTTELVISEDGRCRVYPLNRAQLWLLLTQAIDAAGWWPFRDEKLD